MNNEEAMLILEARLNELRKCSYAELKQIVDSGISKTEEATGQSGSSYQIEIQALWDSNPGGHIRVLGAIDDGGWHSLLPLTTSFIIAADGSPIGE